jgi:hypothetical protein
MPRGKQLDVGEKAKVMAWFAEGVSTKEIANRLKRDTSTVRHIICAGKNLLMSANPPLPKPRSGRPRLTNCKLDKRLRRYLLRYPFKMAKELKAEVIGWQNVLVWTIQKLSKVRPGLPSRCAAKKPLLTAKMVKKGSISAKNTVPGVKRTGKPLCLAMRTLSTHISQGSEGEEVKLDQQVQAVLHHQEREASSQHNGVGLLQWVGWQRVSLLFAQSNNEQRSLHRHAEGQTPFLDDPP